jgi:hypothetical protein
MVASPKGLGPKKDCAGKGQHIQNTDPSTRQRGRPTKLDRNCQRLINIFPWASDGARHQDLLTDRQSQCDFDLTLRQTMTLTKDKPVLSSERASHKNPTVTDKQ